MKRVIITLICFITVSTAFCQEIIPLWPEGKMPNSKGLKLKKIEERERITQVDIPTMHAFLTSKEENKGTAVLIFPPGGYQKLTYNIAGFQLAKWFNTMGINAFVVLHRLPTSPDLVNPAFGALMDAQRAIKIVRSNAEQWGIDKNKIGVMGCSAGGGLAVNTATMPKDYSQIKDALDNVDCKPNFQILVSGAISMKQNAHQGSHDALLGKNASLENETLFSGELNVTETTPPAFIVCAANDHVVSPLNSLQYYQALFLKKIQAALHIFPQGDHAIALRNNPGSTQLWTNLCEVWLDEMGFLTKK
ncbi:alpha/beta hydrolase [Flavobacterium seoulense]|uniref:Pectin acetylesterase n=1 Tax=Flavobacterium seoulense TaxID=1492738 RepID=A0A066WVR9_9FLAO|nr:alpha/beta hydrolase [Flavobacterium seoulense]KDN56688.1 pectin acetylesterase [Flavobacterium seoulense]